MDNQNRKRSQGDDNERRLRGDPANTSAANGEEDLVFEDPFGDEYEVENYGEEEQVERDDEDDDEDEQEHDNNDNEDMKEVDESINKPVTQVWRPGVDSLEEGEALEYDPSAYVMYHSLRTEWPCLSFDILKDNLGDGRQRFPLTMYAVCGSQAARHDANHITLLKLSDLHKTHVSADSDNESDDDDNHLDDDPTLEHVNIPHAGAINRIRSMPQTPGIVATMAETGHAHIYDLSSLYTSMLNRSPRSALPTKPVYSFKGHSQEGYALDWSPAVAGQLATGDCAGAIHVWKMGASAAAWKVDAGAYTGHSASVEDIQWSPSEASVFCTASADRSVRVWDVRSKKAQITAAEAHTADVNVISWNRSVGYLLASGSDDGSFKVWDLRAIRTGVTLANFKYHTGAITSVEWAPHDESVLCCSSADNQVTIWDLSVEADEDTPVDPSLAAYPPQLLFIHQGQQNVKEIHHHAQIPGVIMTTAEDGLNVFKPAISVSA